MASGFFGGLIVTDRDLIAHLIRSDVAARCELACVRVENESLRETNRRLNRRAQSAEAAIADLRRCVEEINGGKPWCGGSLGRAFLAWDNARKREEIERLREFIGKLAERVFAAHEVLGRVAERREKK